MTDWRAIVAVLVGGGAGALCRYLVGAAVLQRMGPGFPYGTMIINLVGCFLIGIISELAISRSMVPPLMRTFIVVGILGGFTTFSSFSYDAITLIEDAAVVPALLYVGVSVFGGILAAFGGVAIIRLLP